jgi:hypothetical protein
MVLQLLPALGVPSDQIGVTTPERIPTGQGMLLAIPCPDETLSERVRELCRSQGAEFQVQRG